MSLITFVVWKWRQVGCRSEYEAHHVNVWCSMLKRSFDGEHRIICITDDPTGITECETFPLWNDYADLKNPMKDDLPSCYRRLKIFHEPQTREMGIEKFSKVVSMDLDVIFMREVNSLFNSTTADFVGWRRIGPGHPNGYNGSIYMFQTGTMDMIWNTFDPKTSPMIARRAKHYGSDQGWMSFCLPGATPGWGKMNGIYSFSSDIAAKQFPTNARLIMFNGRWKPWHLLVQAQHPWIKRYWRMGEIVPGEDFVSHAQPRMSKRFV